MPKRSIQRIYDWFSAVMQQDLVAMAHMLKQPDLTIDALHPLRHTTALMEATRLGRTVAANYLVSHGAAPGLLSGNKISTPLHIAIRMGNTHLVEAMLAGHDSMHAMDHQGRTLMHMLAQHANHDHEAKWLALAQQLIEKNIRLDALDSEGITALHYSLIHEWPALTELLLIAGANPNALALDSGVSPLLMAALNQQRTLVRLLLRYGANPTLPASDGQTAVMLMPDIAAMLRHSDVDSPYAAMVPSPTKKSTRVAHKTLN